VNPAKKPSETMPQRFHFHDLEILLHPEVYDPAEDSFLLLESLMISPKDTILELGTGCGLIALTCAFQGATVVCTDINPYAVQLTRQNIERNRHLLKGAITVRQGDLFSIVKNSERFNLILFNPPYLPTKKNERTDTWFNVATDGGPTGLRLTKQFLHGLRQHLQPDGAGYFIFSSLSNRILLEKYLKKEQLSSTILTTKRYEGEDLDVYRVTPTDSNQQKELRSPTEARST
jgi:release factor glutamine methyltransferase